MNDQVLIQSCKWVLSEQELTHNESGNINLRPLAYSSEQLAESVMHYKSQLERALSGWGEVIQDLEILMQSKVEKLCLQQHSTTLREQGLLIKLIVKGRYRLVPVVWQSSAKDGSFEKMLDRAIDEEILPEVRAACRGEYLLEKVSVPLILEPWLASQLIHECIGHSSEADNYLDYMKPNGYPLGTVWTEYPLQVYDDPTMEGMRGGYERDHEGSPAFCTQLLTDGVWTGLLHNRETVKQVDGRLSCHGRRVVGTNHTLPRMSVTYAAAGKESFEELIHVERGLYCIGTWGGGSIGLEFLIRPAYGIWIEEGRMTNQIIRGFDIRGDKMKTIRQIDAVGNTVKFFNPFFGCDKNGQNNLPVSHGSPHLRLRQAELVPISHF